MDSSARAVSAATATTIAQELTCASAFACKHDTSLNWDVSWHEDRARDEFEKLAFHLGYRVERLDQVIGHNVNARLEYAGASR